MKVNFYFYETIQYLFISYSTSFSLLFARKKIFLQVVVHCIFTSKTGFPLKYFWFKRQFNSLWMIHFSIKKFSLCLYTVQQIDSSTIDGNVEFVHSQYICILSSQVSIQFLCILVYYFLTESISKKSGQRNWIFATNSDFPIPYLCNPIHNWNLKIWILF